MFRVEGWWRSVFSKMRLNQLLPKGNPAAYMLKHMGFNLTLNAHKPP